MGQIKTFINFESSPSDFKKYIEEEWRKYYLDTILNHGEFLNILKSFQNKKTVLFTTLLKDNTLDFSIYFNKLSELRKESFSYFEPIIKEDLEKIKSELSFIEVTENDVEIIIKKLSFLFY